MKGVGMPITPEQVKEWKESKANLKYWKGRETDLRRVICDAMIQGRVEHFSIKEIVGDEELKASAVLNMAVDEADLNALHAENPFTAAELECFKRPLGIVDGKLRKLPRESEVWKAITEKPGMPQLEVKDV